MPAATVAFEIGIDQDKASRGAIAPVLVNEQWGVRVDNHRSDFVQLQLRGRMPLEAVDIHTVADVPDLAP